VIAKLIPLPYRILIGVAFMAALFAAGFYAGDRHVQLKWDVAVASQKASMAKHDAVAAQVTTKVVTQYVDRVQVVHEKARTIVKEVPIYVTKAEDAACTIPVGFVRLHDAAAANVPLSGPAGPTDASPSGIALSTVSETVAVNYEQYHEVVEQLTALQDWVRQQQAAAASKQ
jgi:hypothetical protein